MKTYTKESLIDALIDIRNKGWILSARGGNAGSVGNTLEDLLGITENNLPIPNASEWEIKAQRRNTNSLITLFHMEPSPRAYRFVPSILLPNYGWSHQEAGNLYSDAEKSFRQTINARAYSDRGFTVKIDRVNRRVFIDFDVSKINMTIHNEWGKRFLDNKELSRLDPTPYWGFDDLFHKAGTKLHNCFYVSAQSRRINGREHFLYDEIYMLKGLSLEKFIDAIEAGSVYIDFDARTGHNHGTKFRLRPQSLIDLYDEVKKF
ncbi:MAG: MvaI/BcnI family restriction endonuclease [Anaerolineales bacterium]|jgi:hypothetical protein|nr:MAG: MvaI/BcnI family restriction endonuclease [Anaerolineales bacterium]